MHDGLERVSSREVNVRTTTRSSSRGEFGKFQQRWIDDSCCRNSTVVYSGANAARAAADVLEV